MNCFKDKVLLQKENKRITSRGKENDQQFCMRLLCNCNMLKIVTKSMGRGKSAAVRAEAALGGSSQLLWQR